MHPVNSFRNVFLLKIKVADWNHHQNGDWWRDTEFLCPATLKAVVKLSTMVIKEKSHVFCCMNCSLVSFYTLELFSNIFSLNICVIFWMIFRWENMKKKWVKWRKRSLIKAKKSWNCKTKSKHWWVRYALVLQIHALMYTKKKLQLLSPLLQYSLEPVNEKGLSSRCYSSFSAF